MVTIGGARSPGDGVCGIDDHPIYAVGDGLRDVIVIGNEMVIVIAMKMATESRRNRSGQRMIPCLHGVDDGV